MLNYKFQFWKLRNISEIEFSSVIILYLVYYLFYAISKWFTDELEYTIVHFWKL